jgi:hydroxyacylglutathione hydrolase
VSRGGALSERLTEVAPGVLVATSEEFMTTTTVVTAPGGGCLVIDPAITVADLQALAAELRARGLAPRAGFATHPHWDHVLWCAELGDVPRYASPGAAEAARSGRDKLLAQVQEWAPGHDLELFGRLTPLAAGATVIGWDGPRAEVVIHDGHATGHAAVFLPDTGTLVAGDMCSDIEVPLPWLSQADPLGNYRAGLARLAALPVQRVVPGHGTVGDGAEFQRRIEADTEYLAVLERGEDFSDPRLTQDWLREEHEEQLRYVRGETSA